MSATPAPATGPVEVTQQALSASQDRARSALARSAVPGLLAELVPGPYGTTIANLQILQALEAGLAGLLATRQALLGRIVADRRQGFAAPEPTATDQAFAGVFAAFAGLQRALDGLDLDRQALPPPERHLKLAEYRPLLTADPTRLLPELLADLAGWLRFHRDHPDAARRPEDETGLVACVGGYLRLVASTAARLGAEGPYAGLLEALVEHGLALDGARYAGFQRQPTLLPVEESGLLPVQIEDIVGNREVIETGVALARSVAGFDLARGINPLSVRNPVLFVLGRPGCGKTITAHAIGNHFLDLCKRSGIPARFRIIRRTDWASHYQNRSAEQLLSIFQNEIFNFHGVAGVYWPDIDTAFAAREDPGIRAEEKAILGTLFGLLDGTIGPKNGKWFLIADANHLTMDEAALSRLSQDPHHAHGARTVQEYVALMRDKKLARVAAHLTVDEQGWRAFGERCVRDNLSGRAVDNMANKVLTLIERVDVPDSWYALPWDDKQHWLLAQRRSFDTAQLLDLLDGYVRFEQQAEERARAQRFEQRVGEIRERLAAQAVALGAGEGFETSPGEPDTKEVRP